MAPNEGNTQIPDGMPVAAEAVGSAPGGVLRPPLPTSAVRGTFYASGSLEVTEPARRWLAAQLDLAGVALSPHRVDDALLMLDELVTNVIVHTASGPTVRYGELGDRVVVEVFDRHWGAPTLRPLDPGRESGLGLRLVDALADAWGWARTEDGRKFVWFEVS